MGGTGAVVTSHLSYSGSTSISYLRRSSIMSLQRQGARSELDHPARAFAGAFYPVINYHMHCDGPLDRAPATGRIRPYNIGDSADVEAAWSMYHCHAVLLREPRAESMRRAARLRHGCPLRIPSASSPTLCPGADVLWRGPEAAGGADAMIEAPHTRTPHARASLAEKGGRWPYDVRNPRGRRRPRCVEGVGL